MLIELGRGFAQEALRAPRAINDSSFRESDRRICADIFRNTYRRANNFRHGSI